MTTESKTPSNDKARLTGQEKTVSPKPKQNDFTEHSPSPWELVNRAGTPFNKRSLLDANGRHINDVWFDLSDQDQANAHLIVAAPETAVQRDELLEVLEDVVGLVAKIGSITKLKKVQAVIARAKGE